MPKLGVSNNPSGRPVGTPNKNNRSLRELLSRFLTDNFELIQADFQALSPKDRVKLWGELLSYAMPRLQPIPLGESELGMDIASLSDDALTELKRRFEQNGKPVIRVNIVEHTEGYIDETERFN